MAGIALKGQCDFVSIMVPPKMSRKEKCSRKRKIFISKVKRNAAFSRLLTDRSVTASRILIKYVGANFLSMEVFKLSEPPDCLKVKFGKEEEDGWTLQRLN